MPSLPSPFPMPELAQSLSSLAGVGPATAKALAGRGIATLGDALFFFPLRYEDRRQAKPICELVAGEKAVVKGKVLASGRWGRGGKVYRLVTADDRARVTCLWFRFKKVHLEQFAKGCEVFLVGEALEPKGGKGGMQMIHPEIYLADQVGPDHASLGRVLPIYPQVEGVRQGNLRRIMAGLMARVAGGIEDPLQGLLPDDLYPLAAGEALQLAHAASPEMADQDLEPEASSWRKSLALNELFYFELGLALMRRRRRQAASRPLSEKNGLLKRFLEGLPFELTPGQKQAVKDIAADLAGPCPMARLLAGDVGTGKTVVAAAAVCRAAGAGVQSVFMAPTEVLARQHLATLRGYLEPLGIRVVLAVGSQDPAQRRQAQKEAKEGAQLIVGTHALLSEGFEFKDLGLVIIDEQHRFGVRQRLGLSAKGVEPHLLVLSATPIPRTLALALAGHLDISDLPQRPRASRPVKTSMLEHEERGRALQAMEAALERGEQIFVICPLVEESDKIKVQDAVQTHRRLAEYFPRVGVGLLHGRMDGLSQQRVLDEFKAGKSRILVATTVVEVGVDVPAATLMVVLGAERFGLSQLHQLRGRVGRGERPGLCLTVAGPQAGDLARQRLEVLCSSNDGLELAEADLYLRGPGEALGARQSGLPPFRVVRWDQDAELAPRLREIIAQWMERDPGLHSAEFRPLKAECLRRWGRRLGLVEAG